MVIKGPSVLCFIRGPHVASRAEESASVVDVQRLTYNKDVPLLE
jgi:hypothetical protein